MSDSYSSEVTVFDGYSTIFPAQIHYDVGSSRSLYFMSYPNMMVRVGSVSEGEISYGTVVDIDASLWSGPFAVVGVGSRAVVVYSPDNTRIGARVLTVTGESVSCGAYTEFTTNKCETIGVAYDSATGKVVVSYIDADDAYKLKTVIGTVSGDTISFGAIQNQSDSGAYHFETSIVYDAVSSRIVVCYTIDSGVQVVRSKVGLVSGDTISFGSPTDVSSTHSNGVGTCVTSDGKIIAAFKESGAKVAVGTVSGSTVTFGAPTAVTEATALHPPTYDSTSGKVILFGSSANGGYASGAINGSVFAYGYHEYGFPSERLLFASDSANGVIVVARVDNDSPYDRTSFLLFTSAVENPFWKHNYGQSEVAA